MLSWGEGTDVRFVRHGWSARRGSDRRDRREGSRVDPNSVVVGNGQADVAAKTADTGESDVRGVQQAVVGFGGGDARGVVPGDGLAKLPRSGQHGMVLSNSMVADAKASSESRERR